MDARTIREAVIEGLEAGGVHPASRAEERRAFLAGERDFVIAELEMDSLARMELCIAIEIATGLSLAPEELGRYATLGALVDDVGRRCAA